MYLQDLLTACIISVTATAIPCPVMMVLISSILKYGRKGAYVVIISTVLFDLILGIISAVSFNNNLFTRYGSILDILSGMLFLLIAYSELNRDNDKNRHCTIKSKDFNVIQLFVQVAGLTFFSPIAFACWISTFSINTDVELTFANACYIITSAIIGSILVWLIITVVILKIKQNLQYYWLDRVKYISSAILGVFGAMMIVGI